LGFKIGNVFVRITGGMSGACQQGARFSFKKMAGRNETRCLDVDALYVDGRGA
jgi:hypothetical protein